MSNGAPYNSAEMRVLEAKDFLVQQTAEQAALENVPLSDLEKRMMHFTESGACPEDPDALNEAFDAECSTDQYEAKISKLMHHAFERVKKETPELARKWNVAIGTLRKGDHYLLVLWDQASRERPPYDQLKLLLAGLLLAATMMGVTFLGDQYGISWKYGPKTTSSMPEWLQHLIWILLILGVGGLLVKHLGSSSNRKKEK